MLFPRFETFKTVKNRYATFFWVGGSTFLANKKKVIKFSMSFVYQKKKSFQQFSALNNLSIHF